MSKTLFGAALAVSLAGPALAEGFQRVEDREKFLSIVSERDLTRFAIRVKVTPTGDIVGSAFGQKVSGDWVWRDGYFCRSLFWGGQDIGDNCQTVEVSGETVRFTSDLGRGQYADLRID